MKKSVRLIIPFLLVSCSSLLSCSMYSSKADKKENIIGCYELDVYQSKKESSEEEPYDRKAEEGILAYFTIDMDGYGYYGYKDNKTEAKVEQVFASFTADDDNPELFKAVSLKGTNQTVYYWEKKVGCLDEPPMGYKNGTLSYTLPWHEYTIYNPPKVQKYQYVSYKKISDKTGYKEINKLLGTNYKPDRPYEMKYMQKGFYAYRVEAKEGSGIGPKGIYEYALLDMNNVTNNQLRVIYSLKDNPGKQFAEINFAVKEKGLNVAFNYLNKEFVSSNSAFATAFDEETDIRSESFTYMYSPDLSLDEVIDLELAN